MYCRRIRDRAAVDVVAHCDRIWLEDDRTSFDKEGVAGEDTLAQHERAWKASRQKLRLRSSCCCQRID